MRLVFAALLAVGCSHVQTWKIQDSPPTWSIECDTRQGECMREAAKLCPTGFVVLDQGGESNPTTTVAVTQYGAYASTRNNYRGDLMIQCPDPVVR
jgi:hypothetical protein